ncbi:polypeptide N-acetylgalactosaminyltransferase 15 [Apodemus sylvaticus]|uniref:polypeptide N-acetylgalactosaminyltransferase 15 n=1 Tax=Apodemus sylvaticus TaxID=10129 RepID=UPI002243E2CF|nr:polypeptide N-acetylgalactosaminyltransferase 15 [Apodemus sylvaticus]
MLLRTRPRSGRSRLQFLLLSLTLGCVLMMLIVLHSPPPTLHQAVTAQANKHSPDAGYRLDFGDSQEWVLEAEAEGEEYSFLDGLPPLISLQEDQLLVAVASPRARRSQSQGRRQGSYQFIKHTSRRQDDQAPEKDWRTEEDGEESEEEALTPNKPLGARLPLRRVLPEVRHPLCLQQHPTSGLPTASVILCFHDEAWPTLLRTVHSILDTAPRALLQEIILVDDLSQQEPLKSALSEYVAGLEAVKLLRSNKRLGTIGARMLGATRATGDVLVFMDTHCECHPGWLEPLLSRIAGDRSRVVSPVIDVIDWKTLQYSASTLQRGALDWKLDFRWEALGEQELKALPSPISPIRSPVVPQEVVAVDRHYFQNTGAYDPLLSLWGSENLEMSFKAWLCGGSVEILPCSRVGYIYQSQEASSGTDPEVILRNKIRIAETWLSSFKETFYRHIPEAFALSKVVKPDCTERLKLQRRLGCRTFHWFLANVYPELYPSEHRPRFSGKLHNNGFGLCADCQAEGDILGCPVTLAPCSNSRQQQNLEHTSRKEILLGSPQRLCFDVRGEQVTLQTCREEGPTIHQQFWDFQEDGMIIHILSGKCVEAGAQPSSKDLYLHQCDGKPSQLWRFDQTHPVEER